MVLFTVRSRRIETDPPEQLETVEIPWVEVSLSDFRVETRTVSAPVSTFTMLRQRLKHIDIPLTQLVDSRNPLTVPSLPHLH
jgi:hypothetical protein